MRENLEAKALFVRCAGGDEEAWSRFLERYRPFLALVARRALAQVPAAGLAEVEECVQEIVMTFLKDGGKTLLAYDPRFAPTTWLGIVGLRTVRNRMRREGRISPEGDARILDSLASSGAGPGEALERGELLESLRREMAFLEVHERLALRMAYGEGLAHDRIARLLGMTEGGVANLLLRCRNRLREKLLRK